jgi:hypothetical protein
MSPDPLLSRGTEELARFARVEPPAELDAWVRARLRAAVGEHAPAAASAAGLLLSGPPLTGTPRSARSEPSNGVSPEAARTVPARVPVAVPLVERLALAVGAVACGVQASGFVVRLLCSVLTLGR